MIDRIIELDQGIEKHYIHLCQVNYHTDFENDPDLSTSLSNSSNSLNSLNSLNIFVHPHFTIKNNFQCLTAKFLYQKASDFAKAKKIDAFKSVLGLLIYGIFLFPDMDNFVDLNAIKIFLTKNPVPTLLVNTYHSIHHRNSKGDGTIVCCAPLLYKLYASHLP